LRDLGYHRSVNNAQSRYAFNAKGLIDDRPDTASADRVVERVCRPKSEVAQIRGVRHAGARIDLLSPPIGKGGRGTDFARQPGTLHEDIEIDRFGPYWPNPPVGTPILMRRMPSTASRQLRFSV
jgi:hypothetical protein